MHARSSSAFVPQRRQVLDEVDEFFLVIACDKFSGMIEIFCLTRRAMVLAGMSWYLPSVSLIVTASGVSEVLRPLTTSPFFVFTTQLS